MSSGVGSQFPALQQPPSLASRSNLSNSRHSSTQRGLPLHEHYNTPLELPLPWRSTDRTWTHAQLDRERAEFFETRVTGRPEIWGALKNVCELLREGELATAQGILEAAGITMPTGALTDGCYDEAGNLYRLPEVILLDPINVLPDETVGEMGLDRPTSNIDGETMVGPGEMKTASVKSGEVDEAEKEEDAEARERRREEKGKGIERDAVKVKCRLSDRGGPDVVVFLGKTQTVGTLARRVKSDADVSFSLVLRGGVMEAFTEHLLPTSFDAATRSFRRRG